MRDLLIRYRRTVVLALALLLPVASMYHHGKVRAHSSWLERSLMAITAPIQEVTGAGMRWGLGVIDGYVLLTRVRQRNQALLEENQVLLGEALRSRQLAAELARVKQLCDFRSTKKGLTTVPARVVGREVSQFFRVARIKVDAQGIEGLREGMAVITHNGVVGRIDKVSGAYADVMLITDSRSQIHATIAGKGVIGTVRGTGKRNEFKVRFVYLERAESRAQITDGDAVLTTGHDRVFPAGLEIGHILSDKTTQRGSYHQHSLTPAVALATLEEVLIVLDHHAPRRKPKTPRAAGSRRLRLDPANTPDG